MKTSQQIAAKLDAALDSDIALSTVPAHDMSLQATTDTASQRVLFLINSLEGGGAERVFTVVLDHIQPFLPNIQVEVVLLDDRPSRFDIKAPFKVTCLKSNGGFLDSAQRLHRYLSCYRPHVVVSFLTRSNYLTAAFAKRFGYKAVISERSDTNGRLGGGIAGHLKKMLVRLLYPKAAKIVAVAEGIKDSLISDYGVKSESVQVIYNPYDIETLNRLAAEPSAIAEDGFILSVGRLVTAKRFDVLIRAYARGEFAQKLVIAGEGPELERLKALCRELNVEDRVLFPGFLANPYALMARSAVFVLSSDREGFPNAMVEAMCIGKPIVATNCHHGPAEILDEEKLPTIEGVYQARHGILVPPQNVDALAKALQQMLSSTDLVQHYAAAAKRRAQDFTTAATVSQFAQLVSGEVRVAG